MRSKYTVIIFLSYILSGCVDSEVSYVPEDNERFTDYKECRHAERSSLRWRALAQCIRLGWNENIGGGCEHIDPKIPTETDEEFHLIYELRALDGKIERALEYCEVFR